MDPDALCLGIAGQKEGFSAAPHGSQTGLIKGVEGRFASGWRCAVMICPGTKHADQANVTYQKKTDKFDTWHCSSRRKRKTSSNQVVLMDSSVLQSANSMR